jgi:hypothetical protein
MSEEEDAEFIRAMRKLPRPVACCADGAVCPWCGALHRAVTFGQNQCDECDHGYSFGYPEWHEGKEPISYVPFPWREWEALGQRADLIENWSPNKQLQQLYFKQSEEQIGILADLSKPN